MKAILIGGKSHLREFEIGADIQSSLPFRWYMPVFPTFNTIYEQRQMGYFEPLNPVMDTEEYRFVRIMAGRAFYVVTGET